jgi:hypothetical protein
MMRTLSEGATSFPGATAGQGIEGQTVVDPYRDRCFGKPITSMLNTSRLDNLKPLSSSEIFLPAINLDKAS